MWKKRLKIEADKIVRKNKKSTIIKGGKRALKERKRELIFENVYDDGEYFWFTEYEFNALFKMNKADYKVELVGIFPEEIFTERKLYISTAVCNQKMYFAPYSAKEIAIYDLKKKVFEKKSILDPRKTGSLEWECIKFFKIISVDNKVYFIPDHYPGILCYDTKTKEFRCFDDWVDEIEKKRISDMGYFFACIHVGDKLILPCGCMDGVVIFDTISQKSKIIFTQSTEHACKFCGIWYRNDYFYLVSADGTVTKRKLDYEDEEVKRIRLPKTGIDEIEFYPMVCLGKYIYFFPFKNSRGFRLDMESEEIMTEELFDDEKNFEGNNPLFLSSFVSDEKIYTITGNSHRFIQYDLKNRGIFSTKLTLSESDRCFLEQYRRLAFAQGAYKENTVENEDDSLRFMLDALREGGELKAADSETDKQKTGSRIFQSLK